MTAVGRKEKSAHGSEADLSAGLLRRQTICAGLMSALVELDRP